MSDEPPEVTIIDPPKGVIEIDGGMLAGIILSECHTTATRAQTAANRILEYLGGLLNAPHKVN